MLDWRALPVRLAATLAAGLPGASRCKLMLTGQRIPAEIQLQAVMTDSLHRLEWRLFGREGSKPPPSILAELLGLPETEAGSDVQSYDTPAEFEAACAVLKGGS